MSQSVLGWVADALRAERESLEVMLQARHDNFLNALAGELDGLQWKNGAPSLQAIGSSSWGQRTDVDLDKVKQHQPAKPIQSPLAVPVDPDTKQSAFQQTLGQVPQARPDTGQPEEEREENWRERVQQLLRNPIYEYFIGVVILTNSITMGLEAQFEIEGKDRTVFKALEHFFLLCYTAELCLWFFAYGRHAIKNGWVAFDLVLVCMGILGTYIVEPIMHVVKDSGNASLKDTLAGLLVLRIVRLFRLARIVRVLIVFKTLWMLVRGLMGSMGTIIYTMSLILVMIYMFACLAIEVITKKMQDSSNPDIAALVEQNFGDLPTTMLSLLQFVSMDSISSLYFPLIVEDPGLMFYFIPFILIVSVSLMNLVTAVIVEGAIEQGNQDREVIARYKQHSFRQMQPHLRQMFKDIDMNSDNSITREELLQAPETIRLELQDYMQSDSGSCLVELFDMLDVDTSGEVDIDEFCDGLGHLATSRAPVELIRVLKQLTLVRKDVLDTQILLRQNPSSCGVKVN